MKLHSLTYLVVDDLELMRAVTVNQLRAMGCEKIYTARNGAEALRMLRANAVDVILSDWNMPVMSGLELLRAVRADPKLARLPFVMITAEAERQRIEEVIAAGVSSLLVKPYNAGNLKDRLLKLIADPQREAAPGAVARLPRQATPASTDDGLMTEMTLSPTRILVVDDYPVSLKLMVHLFKDEYQVLTATDGASALAQCSKEPLPDLVLMDVMMPDMDGFEAVRRLREQPISAQIPVIFVTGLNDDEARLKGMALGAVDFVSKDTDPKVMRSRVRNFIKFVDMRRHLQADYDAMLDAARLREDVENITRHDLKGSLAGIVGMVQGMAEDADMAPQHVAQLRLLEQTAMQVMNMINLSSELYKIETGHFKLKADAVDVGHILHRLVELSRSAFTEKKLTIVVDTDTNVGLEMPTASADAMLCYSLFQNLLKNACEAAPAGSRVLVTLKDENPLRVLIQNVGAVPLALRERFFDKFVTSGKPGGSGIGTYSARLLATAQQGDVTMTTDDTDNSTLLTITLPRHVFDLTLPIT
ncbi:MAG: hybrid sensor histidine kinase/response regulator [Rhodoferax sp.]|uniref:hybrid sensor histidine kinase/response regulator n=1 Tax=Rhodoferax sp. TaxID=50421 RepID=UPI003016A98F